MHCKIQKIDIQSLNFENEDMRIEDIKDRFSSMCYKLQVYAMY